MGAKKTEVQLLQNWLANKDNSAAWLAAELGYKSSTVVNQWIGRGNIPHWVLPRLLEIITGKAKTK